MKAYLQAKCYTAYMAPTNTNVIPSYFPEFKQEVPPVGRSIVMVYDCRGTYRGWLEIGLNGKNDGGAKYFIYGKLGYKSGKTIRAEKGSCAWKIWKSSSRFELCTTERFICSFEERILQAADMIDLEDSIEKLHFEASQIEQGLMRWAHLPALAGLCSQYNQALIEIDARHQKELADFHSQYRKTAAQSIKGLAQMSIIMSKRKVGNA